MNKLTIGSRDSKLALIQSNWVRDRLLEAYPEMQIDILEIKTQGDKILDVALSKIGDKGLFTKELENELLAGTIDLAVHSMKDLPTKLPDGLEICATSLREDIRDVVCMSQHAQDRGIKTISETKTIATSSLRRIAQLKNLYPEINFVDIRGNLQTRFRKLDDSENQIDGMILAAAGLKRLKLEDRITEYLDPEQVLPAVGQGALGIEIASNRNDVKELLQVINSKDDELMIKAERAFLRELEGGCQVPIGTHTTCTENSLELKGIVASLDGSKIIKDQIKGKLEQAEELGIKLAQQVIEKGAMSILTSLRARS